MITVEHLTKCYGDFMAVSDLSGIPLHPGAEKYYREIGVLK